MMPLERYRAELATGPSGAFGGPGWRPDGCFSIPPSGATAIETPSHAAAREAQAAADKLPGMGETTSLIAQKFVAHAAPILQRDKALQARVGGAAGAAAADRLAGPAWVAAAAIAAIAAAVVYEVAT